MEIKLLIGLGNPGREYENTYHNVGKLFIDYLAGKRTVFKKERRFEYANLQLTARKLTLVKTSAFMNQSGGAVILTKKYFNAKTNEILIVHDDTDIPLGDFKLSFDRGSAGHQGIKSIIKSLRTGGIYRLRIGVRSPRERRRKKAGELVLKKIGQREKKILQDLFRNIRAQYF